MSFVILMEYFSYSSSKFCRHIQGSGQFIIVSYNSLDAQIWTSSLFEHFSGVTWNKTAMESRWWEKRRTWYLCLKVASVAQHLSWISEIGQLPSSMSDKSSGLGCNYSCGTVTFHGYCLTCLVHCQRVFQHTVEYPSVFDFMLEDFGHSNVGPV